MRTRLALCIVLAAAAARAAPPSTEALLGYIHRSWSVLNRDHHQLVQAAIDPKIPHPPARWPVYVAPDEDLTAIERGLRAELPAAELAQLAITRLPVDGAQPAVPGILYLPRPYVVPGGRFNEMYGWDSYFIVLGLLRDGRIDRARDMVDDFIYEVEHYGKVLNANRSYYLTRSQPPLLTAMILAVYRAAPDRAWLARTLPAVERYYRYFTEGPHLTPTGLSRYFDSGHGPAPEVDSERDAEGRSSYDRVRGYFRTHTVPDYDQRAFYDARADRLTDQFYIADRAMRESGFDPSGRFGPFNAGVLDYAPVCLNSFLYLMEKQTAEILRALGREREAPPWETRATTRAEKIEALLWDEEAGLYFDYDFVHRRRRFYPFATTFLPLWVGLAKPEHARRVIANLSRFEAPGGVRTSTEETGMQWDAPFGWAPLELFAFAGLRRYDDAVDAERIGAEFVAVVLRGFIEHGAIFEKYDVVHRRADVAAGLRFGYTSNEIGFGWTNAVVLEIWAQLSTLGRARVAELARESKDR
jgi:alpha,alpha-trehalase